VDETNPIPLRFPYHPGISLASFCAKWEVNCTDAPPNLTIVLIHSPGDWSPGKAEGDARALSAATLSLVSLPIIVTTAWQQSLSKFGTLTEGGELAAVMRDRAVNRGLAVVVPQFVVPDATNATTDGDCNAARMRQDELFTESLHELLPGGGIEERKRSAVFVQPDSDRWRNPFWASMRELAGFIARQACEAEPLKLEDAEWLVEKAAQWLRTGSADRVSFRDFIRARASEFLKQIRTELVSTSIAAIKVALSQGYRALEVVSERTVVRAAITTLEGKADALYPVLRDIVRGELLYASIHDLRVALTEPITLLNELREQFKREFWWNSSAEFDAKVNKARDPRNWLKIWVPGFKPVLLEDFVRNLHFQELHPELQRLVAPEYDGWYARLVNAIDRVIGVRRAAWYLAILELSLVAIIVSVGICLGKCLLCGNWIVGGGHGATGSLEADPV
jgi:hypothetical protein